MELRLKTRKKKRVALPRAVCPEAVAPNDRWSIDFVSDRLSDGRAFRVLSLVDNVSRVSPALEADFKMTGERVCEVLNRAIVAHGLPKTIRLDNGPEFAGKALDVWAYRRGVKLCFSRPGKPTDKAFCDSLNGKLRDEFLATHWFENIADVRLHLETWREEYNRFRPHSSLGDLSPFEWLQSQLRPEKSRPE